MAMTTLAIWNRSKNCQRKKKNCRRRYNIDCHKEIISANSSESVIVFLWSSDNHLLIPIDFHLQSKYWCPSDSWIDSHFFSLKITFWKQILATGFALLLNHFHLQCTAQRGSLPCLKLQGTAVLQEILTKVSFSLPICWSLNQLLLQAMREHKMHPRLV